MVKPIISLVADGLPDNPSLTPLEKLAFNVNASVGVDTYYNYESNSNAIYNVTGTVDNFNGVEVQVYTHDGSSLITTSTGGVFTDSNIQLPELKKYRFNFVGDTDTVIYSITQNNFINLIDKTVFDRAIKSNKKIPSVATQFGYPVMDIEYTGQNLSNYEINRFAITDLVPYYVNANSDVSSVLNTAAFLPTENKGFTIGTSADSVPLNNGDVFTIKDGYSYFSFFSVAGLIKLSKLYIMINRNSVSGSGVLINIYGGDISTISPTILSSVTIPHLNIPDANNIVEVELNNILTITSPTFVGGFWMQIIPLNPDSEYDIALSNDSFNIAMQFSRYTRLYDPAPYEGETYSYVLTSELDSIYGVGIRPLLVTRAEDAVILNNLYQTIFGSSTGFDGPCIVAYKEISLIQVGDLGVPYGPNNYRTVEEIAAVINSSENYHVAISKYGRVSEQTLYSEYYMPYLNTNTPVSNIELLFSSLFSPDGNNRKITIRSATLMAEYQDTHSIKLKQPYVTNLGEWSPVVTGGHIYRPRLRVGDTIYVDGYGDDTIASISEDTITMTNIGLVQAPNIYVLEEPFNFSVLLHSETPTFINKNTLALSKKPLYVSNLNELSIVLKVGSNYETDITSSIVDWDVNNGILILDKDLRSDMNLFVKYRYIEEGSVISSIDLKNSLDTVVDLYIDNAWNIVTANMADRPYFIDSGVLYIHIGAYHLSNINKPEDIKYTDIRLRGGGIKPDISLKEAMMKNIGVIGFYDIGFNDGMNIPQMVLSAKLPISIKTRFDTYELNNILHMHTNVGTKVYADFPVNLYEIGGTNTISLEDGTGDIILEDNSGTILTED